MFTELAVSDISGGYEAARIYFASSFIEVCSYSCSKVNLAQAKTSSSVRSFPIAASSPKVSSFASGTEIFLPFYFYFPSGTAKTIPL